MCDKTYNVLKWMAQLLLPAMGTLYFALASIWHLPYGEPGCRHHHCGGYVSRRDSGNYYRAV